MLLDREKFGGIDKNQEKKFLAEAYSKGEAMAQIIDDLFDISRMEAGLPLPIEKQECDINTVIENVSSYYADLSENHVFSIKLQKPVIIMADQNKMHQVFENLISNAVKYSPGGGEIQIRSNLTKTGLQIDIEDQGTGMTEEQLERVFDKFYRADSSNTAISGLGLGMSIVKTIIEAHSGHIKVKSALGKGTCVTIQLPALDN
ncbi:MAG: HAMP domain-containing histidine kinase, partial [Gammaproteobacteria bacterium]|nr:HAMP domain-containing histidine kinase [Gammaproteobacteria bacterium]NIR94028.1 HAMP domain-containing histidine kinase [Gammaproteobacteria bacterium]